jgi:hypothetical protein
MNTSIDVIRLVNKYKNSKLINSWDDLKNHKRRSTLYKLQVDVNDGSAFLVRRIQKFYDELLPPDHIYELGEQAVYYLSKSTFKESSYKEATELLQACGFNVVINNIDA